MSRPWHALESEQGAHQDQAAAFAGPEARAEVVAQDHHGATIHVQHLELIFEGRVEKLTGSAEAGACHQEPDV